MALTVAVRGLATKDLTKDNSVRVIRREAVVGLLNGAIFGLAIGSVTYFWFGSFGLGAVIGLAMIINLTIAAVAGILVASINVFGGFTVTRRMLQMFRRA